MPQAVLLALGSLVIGCAVLALKALAWWMTGSVALLSDAMESVVNIATATAALVAVRVAARPPDARHPYGHHKAEFLSAILVGVMIVLAALAVLSEAVRGLMAPRPLEAAPGWLLVTAAAGVLNGLWCWVLIRRGRRLRSAALVADGRHLLTDVVSSAGVLVGVLLAMLTGWPLLDPALALLVALAILWSGWQVLRDSAGGLMDEALPEAELDAVRAAIREAAGAEAIEAHDLRTRRAGRGTFVEFHLVVPEAATVAGAHVLCDRIEAAVRRLIPEAVITIHVEPAHKARVQPRPGGPAPRFRVR